MATATPDPEADGKSGRTLDFRLYRGGGGGGGGEGEEEKPMEEREVVERDFFFMQMEMRRKQG